MIEENAAGRLSQWAKTHVSCDLAADRVEDLLETRTLMEGQQSWRLSTRERRTEAKLEGSIRRREGNYRERRNLNKADERRNGVMRGGGKQVM